VHRETTSNLQDLKMTSPWWWPWVNLVVRVAQECSSVVPRTTTLQSDHAYHLSNFDLRCMPFFFWCHQSPTTRKKNDWVYVNKLAEHTIHRSKSTHKHRPVLQSALRRQLAHKLCAFHRLDHPTSGAISRVRKESNIRSTRGIVEEIRMTVVQCYYVNPWWDERWDASTGFKKTWITRLQVSASTLSDSTCHCSFKTRGAVGAETLLMNIPARLQIFSKCCHLQNEAWATIC
jgi:hypothetical protein